MKTGEDAAKKRGGTEMMEQECRADLGIEMDAGDDQVGMAIGE